MEREGRLDLVGGAHAGVGERRVLELTSRCRLKAVRGIGLRFPTRENVLSPMVVGMAVDLGFSSAEKAEDPNQKQGLEESRG